MPSMTVVGVVANTRVGWLNRAGPTDHVFPASASATSRATSPR
jgi:hypothetical protein